MLLQSSIPSSFEAALSFPSDHGKRDLPFEWINAETRQGCVNCNELSQDGSELLTVSTTFETSGSSYTCKRRKLLKNSVVISPLEVEVNEVPVFAAAKNKVEDKIDDGTGASSLSAEKSVSNQQLFLKEVCISVLRSNGLLERVCRKRRCASTDVLGIGSDRGGYTQSCKQCSLSENILNMLLCDQCGEAFHVSCCKPRLRMLPVDEWFCHSCSKMNCNPSNKKSFSKSCITRSYTASRFGLGPIAHMLKHSESYTSKVRIGEDFQAKVPDWCDQISNDVNGIGEPFKMDPAETIDRHASFSVKFPLPKSTSNWLQCREVLYDDSRECVKGTICGKWRRAPFAKVQTDDWDCSCAVLWDPAHADCAVPQELETEQVLQHLKQIEKLKSRLASRKRSSVIPSSRDSSIG